MAAGALGSVLVCPRSSGAATDADAGAVAEALLVVASVAAADFYAVAPGLQSTVTPQEEACLHGGAGCLGEN